ncbi:cation:proton antiporter [Rothia nasimurium]|uniref:cation:proton antiporter n=1 Tax=Rothia nasimurium TaxID=85336 RepID=UPI001F41E18A|nr:sodium:proton antiporter [Rothia nasimurium]
MEVLIVIVMLLLATVVLVSVGDRLNLPWPVLLTLVTAVVIVIPQMPTLNIEPEIILPIFLPPLLWAIGQRVSWGMLRRSWRSVLIYSIALTAVSALVVGWATWMIVPGISIALALAIGAAVAPPDPVAVEAVAEPVGIPRRVISNLQTEGIFNDAVSLVLFQIALAALTAGTDPQPLSALGSFVYSALVAVALGLALGWGGSLLRRNLSDTVARSALTLVIPFGVYIIAEELHASGVVAVVIAAIQMASYSADLTAEERLANTAFWNVLEMLATGLAFGLIGLQAGELLYSADRNVLTMVWHGVLISAVAIGTRLAWLTVMWLWGRWRGSRRTTPRSFAEVLVMTWAGMRGLVTLALALSLPEMADGLRTEAVFIVLTVLFFTMVFPGLTLPWLVRALGVSATAEKDDHEEQELLQIAQRAMWKSMYQTVAESGDLQSFEQLKHVVTSMMDRIEEGQKTGDFQERWAERQRQREFMNLVRQKSVLAAQAAVLDVRNKYDYEVVSNVLYQIDVQVQAQDAMDQGPGALTMSLPKSFINGEHKLDREKAEQMFKTTEMRIISAQKELDDEALRVATRQLPVVGGADARERE